MKEAIMLATSGEMGLAKGSGSLGSLKHMMRMLCPADDMVFSTDIINLRENVTLVSTARSAIRQARRSGPGVMSCLDAILKAQGCVVAHKTHPAAERTTGPRPPAPPRPAAPPAPKTQGCLPGMEDDAKPAAAQATKTAPAARAQGISLPSPSQLAKPSPKAVAPLPLSTVEVDKRDIATLRRTVEIMERERVGMDSLGIVAVTVAGLRTCAGIIAMRRV